MNWSSSRTTKTISTRTSTRTRTTTKKTTRSWTRNSLVAVLIAAAFLAGHLPFLPASLEDLDSFNFALALGDFDVAEHQPHPPGYPLFVLLSRGAFVVVRDEATALALTGVAAGALSVFPLVVLAGRLRGAMAGTPALMAALLAVTSPLFWVTAARPLSDATGLLAALAAQAAILASAGGRGVVASSALAGFAAGVRTQVAWLTLPLLVLVLVRSPAATRKRAIPAYAAGVLAWLVPLVVASGGPRAYLSALSAQGAEDFAGVAMLATTPSIRGLAWSLRDTFLTPWASWSLAAAVLLLAAVGLCRLLLSRDTAFVTAVVAFGPYLVLHLLFQETITTRYALPVVVAVAIFAAHGADLAGRRAGAVIVSLLAAVGLAIGHSALSAYSSDEAPALRMLADMRSAASATGERPVVAMHRRQAFDLRRPLQWAGDAWLAEAERLPSPPRREWLELVRYWNGGGRRPIWFVADPLRSDVALIHHDAPRGRYRWPFDHVGLVGGVRPSVMDWFVFDRPAWFLGEGWALTPETAGVAEMAGQGPGHGPIEGWVSRTERPATLMIGGRHLESGRAARVGIAIDSQPLADLEVAPGFFLRILTIDAGRLTGDGDYAALTVAADTPRLAIEQFDLQPAGRPIFGFGEGWYESEYNPSTGLLWRWTSERAVLHVRPEGHDLVFLLRGETNPAADGARLLVRAGARIVVDQRVGREFSVRVTIPAALLAGPDPTLVVETDQTYVPADDSWRWADRRTLGLRVLECRLMPAS